MLWSLWAKQGEMLRDEPIGETDTDEEEEEEDDDDDVDAESFASPIWPLVLSALCSQVVNLNELKHGLESNSASNKSSSFDFCVINLVGDCAFFSFLDTFLVSNCLRFVCHLSGLGVIEWCTSEKEDAGLRSSCEFSCPFFSRSTLVDMHLVDAEAFKFNRLLLSLLTVGVGSSLKLHSELAMEALFAWLVECWFVVDLLNENKLNNDARFFFAVFIKHVAGARFCGKTFMFKLESFLVFRPDMVAFPELATIELKQTGGMWLRNMVDWCPLAMGNCCDEPELLRELLTKYDLDLSFC